MIFPFAPFPACFFLHLSASGKNSRNGAKGTNGAAGGWHGARSGAVCAKRFMVLLLFGATPAHEPERPPEPWLKGVHPKQAE